MQIRERQLRTAPHCEHCWPKGIITTATEVDHIKPLHKGGTDDPDNLQSLCGPCHKHKTRSDMGWRAKPDIGLDGWPVDCQIPNNH